MKTTKIVTSAIVLTTLGLIAAPAVNAATVGSLPTKGSVGFTDNTDPTGPVDPTDPTDPVDPTDPPINPGTNGPLSLDYVSNFDFGSKNKVSGSDTTYYAAPVEITDSKGTAKEVANYLQVTDNRGSNAGWTVNVKQEGAFTDGTKELTGAQLSMKDQTFNSTNMDDVTTPAIAGTVAPTVGSDVKVVTANDGQGMGTWTDSFGKDAAAKAVALTVPGKTAKNLNSTYTTDLTWTLTDANI
ncbi:WxL domain-containing protein [Dellaglioa sp. P0083]|uniref:WxL domain-containing protein n=1 Tax=Dellaglioa kimchii TaxID=3344667 RepID=UPI0038D417DE